MRGIQEDVAAGALSPAEAIRRIQAAADQARPALQRLAEEAKRFRDSQPGGDAVRRAALDGLVAQAERQAGGLGSRAGVRQVLQAAGQEANRLVQERQQFVQTVNALEQQGLITRAEGERRIQEGYRETHEALREQIRLQQEALDAARETGVVLPGAYAAANAQLDLYRANLDRIDPAMARLRQGIEDTFVTAGTAGFNSLAEAAGNVLARTNTVAEGFENAGRAALQFVADVLKGLGQLILKEQMLIAVQAIRTALSGGSLGVDGIGDELLTCRQCLDLTLPTLAVLVGDGRQLGDVARRAEQQQSLGREADAVWREVAEVVLAPADHLGRDLGVTNIEVEADNVTADDADPGTRQPLIVQPPFDAIKRGPDL